MKKKLIIIIIHVVSEKCYGCNCCCRYVHMTAVDVTLAPDYDMISITDGGSSSYVGDKNIAVISNSNLEEHAGNYVFIMYYYVIVKL